jgi:hypothetical protein
MAGMRRFAKAATEKSDATIAMFRESMTGK